MTIKAIETSYAGCRFRSRLEARWAVFFDHLSMAWEYEPQGFEFEGHRYLPDFYLPNLDMYAEVKGGDVALEKDLDRLEGFVGSAGKTLVILGNVPESADDESVPVHSILHPELLGYARRSWSFMAWSGGVSTRGWRFMFLNHPVDEVTTEPRHLGGVAMARGVADAYRRARSARFEHGETP